MKLFRRKKNKQNFMQPNVRTELRDKLQVEVLGKGSQMVTVDESTKVRDIKDILAVGSNVQAIDEQGRRLSDDENVLSSSSGGSSSGKKVSFIPNVKGGC